MNRIEEIRARRAALVARAAVERERAAVQFAHWRPRLALLDRSAAAARAVLAHPEWLAAGAAVILILRPRRVLAWARNGFLAWRTWRWVARAAHEISARRRA
jgi:hypothetical protein